jgi:hypothetical protein
MPNYYVSGSDLPRQIKSHRSWQRGVGGRRVDIYTGLEADIIARMGTSATPTLAATGWKAIYDEINLTPDENSPLVRAELVLNDPEEPEITWEIIPTLAELDLLNTPVADTLKNIPYIELDDDFVNEDGENSTVLIKLRAIMQDPSVWTFEFDDINVPSGDQAIWDRANQLGDLITMGQRAVPRALPLLRLTQTVASRYDQQLSVTFLGDVLSKAVLYLLEHVPADVLFDIPANPPARYGFTWGWLKMCPSIRRTGRGYFAIQQDWQFGEYPNLPVGLFTFVPPVPPP